MLMEVLVLNFLQLLEFELFLSSRFLLNSCRLVQRWRRWECFLGLYRRTSIITDYRWWLPGDKFSLLLVLGNRSCLSLELVSVMLGSIKIFLHLDLLLDLSDLFPYMAHCITLDLLTHLKSTFCCFWLSKLEHMGDSNLGLSPIKRLEAFADSMSYVRPSNLCKLEISSSAMIAFRVKIRILVLLLRFNIMKTGLLLDVFSKVHFESQLIN